MVFGSVLVSEDSARNLATEYTRRFAEHFYGRLETGLEPSWPEYVHVLPNSSVPTPVLLQAGGFDEQFFRAHEDTELGLRLWKNGVRFRFLRGAGVRQVFVKSVFEVAFDEAQLDGKSEIPALW